MVPLPPINKAYSLFFHEEMQRTMGNSIRVESTALATKSLNFFSFGHNSIGKERLFMHSLWQVRSYSGQVLQVAWFSTRI